MLKAVGDLSGEELNYAVAVAEGHDPSVSWGRTCYLHKSNKSPVYPQYMEWEDAGPIIEREKVCLVYKPYIREWYAKTTGTIDYVLVVTIRWAYSPIVAAMRCFVASKLGAEVEIPGCIAGDTP